jgi:hypothetical protein
VLFATEPDNEPEVRRRIEQALSGQVPLPDGIRARWQLRASSPADVSAADRTGTALDPQLTQPA